MIKRLLCILFLLAFLLPQSSGKAAPAPAPWIDARQHGNIAYFLYNQPAVIRRYDLSTAAWMADIPLSDTPKHFTFDGNYLYMVYIYPGGLSRMNLDGTDEITLCSSWGGADILISGQFLFQTSQGITTRDLQTCDYLSYSTSGGASSRYSSIAHSLRRIYLVGYQMKPLTFDAAGKFEYEGKFGPTGIPVANKTWVFPDETRVADNGGTVYNPQTLKDIGSFNGPVDDLTFVGNQPIVLRGNTLIAYTPNVLETGRYALNHHPTRIFAQNETIFVFYNSKTGPQVEQVALDDFYGPTLWEPPDPDHMRFIPDQIVMGNHEVLYLLSKAYASIFPWSVAERRYLPAIPLRSAPLLITASPVDDFLYTVYPSGAVYQIRVGPDAHEVAFTGLPRNPCGLQAVDAYVFTCDYILGGFHRTFSNIGDQIYGLEPVWTGKGTTAWSQGSRTLFYLADDVSWHQVWSEHIEADGRITQLKQGYNLNGYLEPIAPLRSNYDGSRLFVGPDQMIDGLTLRPLARLPETAFDAAWRTTTLFTLQQTQTGMQVQRWTEMQTADKSVGLPDTPLAIFPIDEGLVTVSHQLGQVRMIIWDESLDLISESGAVGFRAEHQSGDQPKKLTFTLQNPGLYQSVLWDFGDGTTSSDDSPEHTYSAFGSYPVTVELTYLDGTVTFQSYVNAGSTLYLPLLLDFTSPKRSILPGLYLVEDACDLHSPNLGGDYSSELVECIESIEVLEDGSMRFDYSWTWRARTDSTLLCGEKASDVGDRHIYLKDGSGRKYYPLEAGGAAAEVIDCMEDHFTYYGWFLFPAPVGGSKAFTLYDTNPEVMITFPTLRFP